MAIFHEYCEGSSVHGVRYFGREERTACERYVHHPLPNSNLSIPGLILSHFCEAFALHRFWWIVVFLLSMAGCGYMMYKTYIKWDQSPIIVSFSEKATPVWEVPFPAVTICPETKFSAAKLNYTAELKAFYASLQSPNRTSHAKSIARLRAAEQVCAVYHEELYDESLANETGSHESDIVNTLKNLSLNRYDVVDFCGFGGHQQPCDQYLKEIVTTDGICYAFNVLPEDEIFRKEALHTDFTYMEEWYNVHPFYEAAPPELLHATGAGLQAGLSLFLRTEKSDIDYMCAGKWQGFTVMLHEAGEYPQVFEQEIRIPLGHEMSFAVKPQMITTSPSAADYHWSKRQCFFDNERHLRFFRIYNQENCELECLTNVTLAVCGCVQFSMPRAPGTAACALNQSNCMYDAGSVLWHHRNSSNITSQYRTVEGERIASECNCLPACSSVRFDVEMTLFTTDDTKRSLALEDVWKTAFNESDRYVETSVRIYFKESQFMTSRRTELYGMADFLANCGGLLGLFMGVSILSLLEICYYVTIRPFTFRRKRRRGCIREGRSKNMTIKKQTVKCNSLLAVGTKVD